MGIGDTAVINKDWSLPSWSYAPMGGTDIKEGHGNTLRAMGHVPWEWWGRGEGGVQYCCVGRCRLHGARQAGSWQVTQVPEGVGASRQRRREHEVG